eukprot:1143548-Pelagomonas_calceolata.AAC.1
MEKTLLHPAPPTWRSKMKQLCRRSSAASDAFQPSQPEVSSDDDLSLTHGLGEMQVMLNRLRAYARRKGLTVDTSKSGWRKYALFGGSQWEALSLMHAAAWQA